MVARLRVPFRDLRILDPLVGLRFLIQLSRTHVLHTMHYIKTIYFTRAPDMQLPTPYPTAVYIRERALVVNLQSVRVMITAEFAYVISVPSPKHHDRAVIPTPDSPFVKQLMHRVSERASGFKGYDRLAVNADCIWQGLLTMYEGLPVLQIIL